MKKLLSLFLLLPLALYGAAGDIKFAVKSSNNISWIDVILAKQNNALFGTNGSGIPIIVTAGSGIAIIDGVISSSGGGGGIVGPVSSTDDALVRWNGTSGGVVQNSGATLSDAGLMTITATAPEFRALANASGGIGAFTAGDGTYTTSFGIASNFARLDFPGIINFRNSATGNTTVATLDMGGFNNTAIGQSTPAAGGFTTLDVSGIATLTSASGNPFRLTGATTGTNYLSIVNTGGVAIFGQENSTGNNLIVGASAYDTIIRAPTGIAFSAQAGASMQARLSTTGLNLLASGYLNYGATAGSGGYGFRDSGGTIQVKNSGGSWANVGSGAGTGDVVGPASATDNAITRYDGTTGKLIQNSGVIIDDSNNVTGVSALTNSGLHTINAATTSNPSAVTGALLRLTQADSTNLVQQFDTFNGNNSIVFRRADGTSASPTAVQADEILGIITGRGYGATGYSSASQVSLGLYAAENWTDSAYGTYQSFRTTPIGSVGTVESLVLTDTSLRQPASAYHNWGTTSGTSGYGIRDNAGAMQWKDSGGAWAGFTSGATAQDSFTATAAQTVFTLSSAPAGNIANVTVNGVGQLGGTDYTISGTTMTFAVGLTAGFSVQATYSAPTGGGGGSGTVTSVSATAPAAGFTISGSPVTTSGGFTFTLSDDLAAVEGLSSTGLVTRTASNTWTARTATGTANQITVTNGDGVSGNPTFAITSSAALPGSPTVAGTASTAAGGVVTTDGTQTLTAKRVTARITTITSNATPTVNTDNADCVTITALAAAITSMTTNLSGTPVDFDQLEYRIKDDGTARAITWGASFAAGPTALPTTTVLSKSLYVFFEWDSVLSKWVCLSSGSTL